MNMLLFTSVFELYKNRSILRKTEKIWINVYLLRFFILNLKQVNLLRDDAIGQALVGRGFIDW